MRILMVTDFYAPFVGGVEVVVRSLSAELHTRGHHVSVATIRDGDLPTFEDMDGIRIHRLQPSAGRVRRLYSQRRPWAPPFPDPEISLALRRLIARENPDIIHGHDWLARSLLPVSRREAAFIMSLHYYTLSCAKKSLMYRGLPCHGPALAKCLRCAATHYGALKGTPIVCGNFASGTVERKAVDLFLPVSTATAVGNGLPARGLTYEVIPNFVLKAPALTELDLELLKRLPKDDFLLFVGDLRRDKGIEVLLDAYEGLRDAPPLTLIGKLWPDSPKHLPDNVRMFTDWPNSAVRAAQSRSLAVVAPSIWPEAFGMVILEALAAGRPVVATRIGGITELVEHGVSGLLVPPGDSVALSSALSRIIESPALQSALGAEALEQAARFSPTTIVPRFELAYENALTRKRRERP